MADSYDIQMIPIDKINVINSRERSEKSYQAVKGNIENVGLKRPVTVRPSDDGDGYDLVCGEGRLRTFKELGQESIPAIIRHDLPKDDAYVMSLVENMARRQHTAMELMHGIELLLDSGYGVMDISRKMTNSLLPLTAHTQTTTVTIPHQMWQLVLSPCVAWLPRVMTQHFVTHHSATQTTTLPVLIDSKFLLT